MTTAASKTTLAQALLAFQADAPGLHEDSTATIPTKSGGTFSYKYVSLGALIARVRPVLNKHGLVLSQSPTVTAEGLPALRTRIIHAQSGEQLEDVMPLMLVQQDPQGQGSAITYARRYALVAVLGLAVDDDDDGQAATPRAQAGAAAANGAGVSEAQLRKLRVLVDQLHHAGALTKEQLGEAVKSDFNANSIEELSKQQASNLIERLEKYAKNVAEAQA